MDKSIDTTRVHYTVDDILALPEGQRAELINGKWYDMASPTYEHQWISSVISNKLFSFIEEKGGNCKVISAPFAVFLNNDNKNYFEPDISVICDPSKLSKRGCELLR